MRLQVNTVHRAGLRATKLDVVVLVADLPHRRWADIEAMITAADIPAAIRARAVAVFSTLAAAEARAHGVPVADVHFHEVGAWDSIADVVGVCAALHDLGIGSTRAGPVALGSGQVKTAHGVMPVPVPAVLELSFGWQVRSGGAGELTTPTGMALLRALCQNTGELPEMTVHSVGVGAGTRDPTDRANVARVVIGAAAGMTEQATTATVLEANVDDLDPRVWPSVTAELLEAGAADAWPIPILMKKGRPAHTLCVLAELARVAQIRELIFRLVPTLGVRDHPVGRRMLARSWLPVAVSGGAVRIKLGLDGAVIVSATPEYEDVAAVATATGSPVRNVLSNAIAAAGAAGLVPGRTLPPQA
ncbi:MAG: nickel pincer cofactor biosynthesis protein LarC [Candidatus Nanopelagicales bacterium]